MTGEDDALLQEFAHAAAAARRRDFEELVLGGASSDWLWIGPARFGVMPIAQLAQRFYEPAESGEQALIVPVDPLIPLWEATAYPVLHDLIAWRPSAPRQWWHRTGVATILGREALSAALFFDKPLALFSSPEAWLLNQGIGCCILDWTHGLRELIGIRRVIADTSELAQTLLKRLQPQPRIKVGEPPS